MIIQHREKPRIGDANTSNPPNPSALFDTGMLSLRESPPVAPSPDSFVGAPAPFEVPAGIGASIASSGAFFAEGITVALLREATERFCGFVGDPAGRIEKD